MDVKLHSDEGNFKFRVCGVVEQNGKYLIMDVDDEKNIMFPGGHVELNEDTKTAFRREILEEVGCKVEIKKLFCIHENFYGGNGEKFHELAFYYHAVPTVALPNKDWVKQENDKGELKELHFKWVSLQELKDVNIYPVDIKNLILQKKLDRFTHLVFKGF